MAQEPPDDFPESSMVDQVNLEDEVQSSFLEYAMSVIVSRALPDVRDGLKPVHRRILFAGLEAGLRPDRQHRKCAALVGDVMKKYHPHGDQAIYDALAVSYTHLRAHETDSYLVCRLLLEKKKKTKQNQ